MTLHTREERSHDCAPLVQKQLLLLLVYKYFAPNGAIAESNRIVARFRLFFELVSIAITPLDLIEEIQLFIVFYTYAHRFRVLFDHGLVWGGVITCKGLGS